MGLKLRVNIIIRTLNEGKWLPLCLDSLDNQTFKNFHVTIIDSCSSDNTLAIANSYKKKAKLVKTIEQYKPGKSINIGASLIDSEYIVILSAHCIPITKNWLKEFIYFMDKNLNVSAGYGRQLPCNFSGPDDMRDLAYLFRGETHITQSDFLHNANSIIRRDAWKTIPFNEDVNHIEDLIWAQEAKRKEYKIAYIKEAAVSHYHGINQHTNYESFRADSLIEILSDLDLYEHVSFEQISKNYNNKIATAFIGQSKKKIVINKFNHHFFKNKIYANSIKGYGKNLSLSELLFIIAKKAADKGLSAIQIIDLELVNLDTKLIKRSKLSFYKNFPDAVLTCWKDSGNYILIEDTKLNVIQNSNNFAHKKSKFHRVVLGQGSILCVSSLLKNRGEIPSGILIESNNPKILLKANV